jgi:hypothetical protein
MQHANQGSGSFASKSPNSSVFPPTFSNSFEYRTPPKKIHIDREREREEETEFVFTDGRGCPKAEAGRAPEFDVREEGDYTAIAGRPGRRDSGAGGGSACVRIY